MYCIYVSNVQISKYFSPDHIGCFCIFLTMRKENFNVSGMSTM